MAKSKREFYELPNVTTSTDIINAARQSIKAVGTSRPFTPSDKKRSLYNNRPTTATSSIDLSDVNTTPRVLSPIESPKTQKRNQDIAKKETDNFEAYWRVKIAPILGSLTMHLENVDIIKELTDLSDCLLRGGFLTDSASLPQQYKVKVFQCLISLLDKKDTKLLLKISRILLCIGVFEKNLISISKLIFKLTRCEKNDFLFLEERIVHSLLNVLNHYKIEDNGLSFVYCIGALKVLSANTDNNIGEVLLQYGLLQVLERHLATCNSSSGLSDEMKCNLLIQILGAIRNLCDIPATEKLLQNSEICQQLQLTMTQHYSDAEVLMNCCRLLSRMSLFAETCLIISHNDDVLDILVKVIDNYTNDAPLLLRCCFVLGNVTAHHPHASLHLHHKGGVLDSLLSLCKVYKSKLGEKCSKSKQGLVKDVLCKSVRVITNVLQNKEAAVAISPQLIKLFVSLGQVAIQAKIQEIGLNVLCGLNNMSYYNGDDSIFVKHRGMLTEFLIRMLSVDHVGVTIESLGVLGNLSRSQDVVDRILEEKHVLNILTTLVDSDNSDLVYKACGVLINVTKWSQYHNRLPETIISQCTDVLCDVGMLDVQLSTVTLYLLWNILSIKVLTATEEERDKLMNTLTDYLDHDYCNSQSWIKTFHPVAKRIIGLLDKESDLIPL